MGQALREAHSDIFTIKAKPDKTDRALIEGKFKSAHNTSEQVAQWMTSTFYSLLSLADLTPVPPKPAPQANGEPKVEPIQEAKKDGNGVASIRNPTLHYNIQIHLPATKDVEVFNAIFKSLREHLLD